MYEIIPYVGVEEIRYGMKCDEVCGLLAYRLSLNANYYKD